MQFDIERLLGIVSCLRNRAGKVRCGTPAFSVRYRLPLPLSVPGPHDISASGKRTSNSDKIGKSEGCNGIELKEDSTCEEYGVLMLGAVLCMSRRCYLIDRMMLFWKGLS